MTIGGIIADAIILIIALLIIVFSVKRGAVKTILSLVSGIAALLSAYAFTPVLSGYLKEKVFLPGMTASVSDTIASLCESGKDAAQNAVYDVSKLIGNTQFVSLIDKYGADPGKTEKVINGISDKSHAAVDTVSKAVADPVSGVISDAVAFIAIFVAALIVFKIVTLIVGAVFKLPGLKAMDRMGGLIIGIISALFFVLVISMLVSSAFGILTKVAPSSFPEDIVSHSIVLRILSKYNLITKITEALGFLKHI